MQKKVKSLVDVFLSSNIFGKKDQKASIKSIIFYILSLIISTICIKKIPVGAIAIFTSTYAAGFILTPSIIISILGILLSGNIPYVLVYVFYVLLFLSFTILLKPLVAVHEIYEKLKVEKYLLAILFYLNIFILRFSENIYITLMTFGIYKICVNILPMIKNTENKLAFSNLEISSVYMFFIAICQYVFLILNTKFKISFVYTISLSFCITNMLIVGNLYKTNLKNSLIVLILSSLLFTILTNIYFNNIPMLIFLIFLTNIKNYRKSYSIKSLLVFSTFSILLFTVNKDWLLLINTIFITIVAILNTLNLNFLNLNLILNDSNYIPSKGLYNFTYMSDPKLNYKKVFKIDKFNSFKEDFSNSEVLRNNILFSEINKNEDIQKWIYHNLDKKKLINISEFNEILIKNNILVPITEDIIQNDIKQIESESYLILKNIENANKKEKDKNKDPDDQILEIKDFENIEITGFTFENNICDNEISFIENKNTNKKKKEF